MRSPTCGGERQIGRQERLLLEKEEKEEGLIALALTRNEE